MQQLLQGFLDVNNIFWGDDIYHWWFYIAILLILFLEKRKTIKIIFAWYSVFFLAALFSPLSNEIMKKISTAWQYRARLYSMLPIPYVLALGSILAIERICTLKSNELINSEQKKISCPPLVKLVLVAGVCILIIFGGTDVYRQDWMQPAQNIEKVPPAILELNRKLCEKKDACIAVPEPLSSYVRQVNANFYTPYGRYVNSLGYALSQENPDPSFVMNEAGKESCDYIVIYDNETNRKNFINCGYEINDILPGYLIYEVKGVPCVKKSYNEKRQIISAIWLDENGSPYVNDQGYSGKAYEYDQTGNVHKEMFLDIDGNLMLQKQGYAVIERTYTQLSHQVKSIKYLDCNNQPVLINGCYETRSSYDAARRLQSEAYYDWNGNPM